MFDHPGLAELHDRWGSQRTTFAQNGSHPCLVVEHADIGRIGARAREEPSRRRDEPEVRAGSFVLDALDHGLEPVDRCAQFDRGTWR